MPVYQLTARDNHGETRVTTVQAAEPAVAARELQARGLFVVNVVEVPPEAGVGIVEGVRNIIAPVSADSLAVFFRHLASLTKAGHSTAMALRAMETRMADSRLGRFAGWASGRCHEGQALSAQMRHRPTLFPAWVTAMVAVAERSGKFDDLLPYIHEELTEDDRLRQSFRLPVVYFRAVLILAVLMPSLGALVRSGAIAWLLVVAKYYVPALLLFFGAGTLIKWALRRPSAEKTLDSLLSSLPAIGRMQQALGLRRFARTLRCINQAGRSVPEAFVHAATVAGHPGLAASLETGAAAVVQGRTLHEAFYATGVFPASALDYLAQCERAGKLEAFVEWLCHETERMADDARKSTKRALWIALAVISVVLIVLGAVLGLASVLKGMVMKAFDFFDESVP